MTKIRDDPITYQGQRQGANGKEKDEMVKWGTSISFAKFYRIRRAPLRTSGDLMFKVVTILGFIFQQFNSNFRARYKDDPRFGTPIY